MYYRILWHFKLTMIGTNALREYHNARTDNIFTGYTGMLFTPWEMIKAYDLIESYEGGKCHAANR